MAKNSWHRNFKVAPVAGRTSRDGIVFHSKTEMERWEYLRLIEKTGGISGLRRQVKFPLEFKCSCGGIKIIAGTRPAHYTADFVYEQPKKDIEDPLDTPAFLRNESVIEDVKGYRDENSKFRIRVFEALTGNKVTIVKKSGRGRKWRWVME